MTRLCSQMLEFKVTRLKRDLLTGVDVMDIVRMFLLVEEARMFLNNTMPISDGRGIVFI